MPLPIIVLLLVFIAIALRRFIPFKLQIWHILCLGALVVLLTGRIGVVQAYQAVSWQIIFYLFGVFVIGSALERSGLLAQFGVSLLRRFQSPQKLLLVMLFLFAMGSAFLMNDTIAIIGTGVVLVVTRLQRQLTVPLLLGLAFSVTLGSLLSPIGNPQNLLIATQGGMQNAFITFFTCFLLPTAVNLLVTFLLLRVFYRKALSAELNVEDESVEIEGDLARWAKLASSLLLIMIVFKILLGVVHFDIQLSFSVMALISCLPILLFSKRRWQLLRHLDWESLIFFIALFILVQSVWDTGYFQQLIAAGHFDLLSVAVILFIAVLLSQLISNLPLVALYLPLLLHAHASTHHLLALAAGSTIAGNLLLLGAASNILVVQSAERRLAPVFHFLEFARVGIPLTLLNLLVYYVWFQFVYFG